MKRKGTVVQVTGPVVDVAFDGGSLPEINEALTVAPDGQPRMMEVAQHVGGDTVRCIMLSPSEGIGRGDEVLSTGHTIEAPVGEATLGRMFNVLGQPIDEKGDVNAPEKWSIHRAPPDFAQQNPTTEILETGIKVIDLLAPYAKGGKIGLFGGAGVGKTKQQNIFHYARMALCRPGAFLSLWSRNIGPAWPEPWPQCRSPPPHSDLPKNLNGGKADGSYHQL